MKKKLMMVAVLLGALSLGACVDDNESASVTAIRNAKATQLEALAKLASAQADAEAVRAAAEAALNNAKANYQQAKADATAAETAYNTEKYKLQLEKLAAEYAADIAQAKKEAALADQKAWENVDQHIQNVYEDYTDALNQIYILSGDLIDKQYELAKVDVDDEAAQAYYNQQVANFNQQIADKTAQIERLKSLNTDKAALETQLNELVEKAYDLVKVKLPAAQKTAGDAEDEAEEVYYPIDYVEYLTLNGHEKIEWEAAAPAYILAIDTLKGVETAFEEYYRLTSGDFVNLVKTVNVEVEAVEGCITTGDIETYALTEGSDYLDATQKIDRYFAEIIKAKQDYIGTPSVTSGSTTTPATGILYPNKENAEQAKKQHEADLAAAKAQTPPDQNEIARLEKLIEDNNVEIMAAQEAIDEANEELKELQANQKSYEDNLKVATAGSDAQKEYQAIVDEVVKATEVALAATHEVHKIQNAIKVIGIEAFDNNGAIDDTMPIITDSEYDILNKLYTEATTVENAILDLEDDIATIKTTIATFGSNNGYWTSEEVKVYDPTTGVTHTINVPVWIKLAAPTADEAKALIQMEIDNIEAEIAAYEKRAEMYKAELEALIGDIDEEETPAA